jgi:hypothetical protein
MESHGKLEKWKKYVFVFCSITSKKTYMLYKYANIDGQGKIVHHLLFCLVAFGLFATFRLVFEENPAYLGSWVTQQTTV